MGEAGRPLRLAMPSVYRGGVSPRPARKFRAVVASLRGRPQLLASAPMIPIFLFVLLPFGLALFSIAVAVVIVRLRQRRRAMRGRGR